MHTTAPQDIKILRINDVAKRTGVCRATVYNWLKSAEFPRQIQLGPKSVGWVASEVDAWLAGRIAARDTQITNCK